MSSRLTDDRILSLYTISAHNWGMVNLMAATGALIQSLGDLAGTIFPWLRHLLQEVDFKPLGEACRKWNDTTFPGLVAQADSLSDYASHAITSFTELQDAIEDLDPEATLPPAIREMARSKLLQLSQETNTIRRNADRLMNDIEEMVTAGHNCQAAIAAIMPHFGVNLQILNLVFSMLNNNLGLVRGGWQAITDDLDALASEQIHITIQLLLELDIEAALRSWHSLRNESQEFAAMAHGLQQETRKPWVSPLARQSAFWSDPV